jgi:COPII coat assembly protein SEC16
VLLGLSNPLTLGSFHKQVDPIILTEVAEFALSLVPTAKGQEPFAGLVHLQAYRLIRAHQLADFGNTAEAIRYLFHVRVWRMPHFSRYCEAIGASLRLNTRGSAFITQPLLEHLKELSDRLTGAPHPMNKAWGIGKMTKPSIDNLGGWLEGRIKNFIVGDGESEASQNGKTKNAEQQAFSGPFVSYSTMSSAQSSASPSPSPSLQNLSTATSYGTLRPSSVVYGAPPAANRPPSAAEFSNPYRPSSPAVRSLPPTTTAYDPYTAEPEPLTAKNPPASGNAAGGGSSWWGEPSDDSAGRTPTATTFRTGGTSPTWPNSAAKEASSSSNRPNGPGPSIDDDEDDLGFGNSKPRKKREEVDNDGQEDTSKAAATPKKEPEKPGTLSSTLVVVLFLMLSPKSCSAAAIRLVWLDMEI